MIDELSYILVSGRGDNDNESFILSGNQFLAAIEFDYETKASYPILVINHDGKKNI